MLVVAIEQPTPSFDVIKILLDRGADLNKKKNAGPTPLELAIDKNLPEVVAFLLDRLQNISLVRLYVNNYPFDSLICNMIGLE